MSRTKLLLLLAAGGLSVAAFAVWQESSDRAIANDPVAAPPPAQSAQAPAEPVAPVLPPAEAAAVASAGDVASVVTKKPAPRRVIRRDPPAAVTVERVAPVEPPSAPAADSLPAARSTYEQRVVAAATLAAEDPDRAIVMLQQLTTDEPARPEAYEAQAAIRLRQQDYRQAAELLGSALMNGGKATFSLIHDHSRGNFDHKDPKATCVGELTILPDQVRFEAPAGGDSFAASWTEVRDAGANKFFGSGIGGFHVSITTGGKYRNFNLAPESKVKAEGTLILDLLAARAQQLGRVR